MKRSSVVGDVGGNEERLLTLRLKLDILVFPLGITTYVLYDIPRELSDFRSPGDFFKTCHSFLAES